MQMAALNEERREKDFHIACAALFLRVPENSVTTPT